MSRLKVTEAHKTINFWQQYWECKLTCGHWITVVGRNGQAPKTATCYTCRSEKYFIDKEELK